MGIFQPAPPASASTDPERWCHLCSAAGCHLWGQPWSLSPPGQMGPCLGVWRSRTTPSTSKGPCPTAWPAPTSARPPTPSGHARAWWRSMSQVGQHLGCSGTWTRRWAGRQRWELPVPPPQSPASPFGGGNLMVPMGLWSSWLWNGVALVCFGIFSFFPPFLSWSFPFLHQISLFPPCLVLWIQRWLYMLTAKTRQGDIDPSKG